ncbi:SH3 domain-containing protein [Massilia horti]|uniref:SH3 domain-containing protein n=1 Tax=Massilia horti TaxID=2562153 RepID=A0A4Y9SZK1_9BURK|nr:SH3 domain-containing protein [Massilia horti]TFW31877.1 SH3 domain-containing protein [Massilia horti]
MPAPIVTVAALCAGLVATLVLCAYLTPRAWWRRANARALAVLTVGTLCIGSALLWWFNPAANAQAAPHELAAEPLTEPVRYRVYDDLNLRDGTGIGARRVAVVPAGAIVTASGVRKGDWWEVSARVDGREVRGWASSLWLRRLDERR